MAGAAVLLSGCFLSTDLSGTTFLCTVEPICPQGLTCVQGQCVGGGSDGGGGSGVVDGGTDPGQLGDFAFRQRLVLDNRERGELVDFPLLVALDGTRFDYGALRPDGGDLEFIDADGSRLPHEIERWDPQGRSIIWVRVPLIDADSNADFIWMYYGDPPTVVAQDAESVWSSYEEVYHLGDEGPDIDDVSARNYDGTSIGTEAAPGFLGLAQAFGGTAEHIDLGTARDFARAVSGVTVEAWVNPELVLEPGVVFGASVNGDTISRVELRVEADLTLRGAARTQDVDVQQNATTTGTVQPDTWSWVGLVCDFAADEMSIYIDGNVEQFALAFDPTTPDTASSQAIIGANEGLDQAFFAGLLDEVRVAPAAMSPDWVSAQNASMRDRLVDYGSRETL